jgi:phosphatidylserine decarboxylase
MYRNNYRHVFSNTQNVLAPIDGTITAIDNTNGKYKIYCKVGLLNNHVLRAPIDAELKIKKFKHGLNLNPNTYKASLYNEQIVLKFDDIKLKIISGLCNSKMKRPKETNVSQGDKIGVFIDGIVIITVSSKNNLLVNIGDKVTSAQTVLFKK